MLPTRAAAALVLSLVLTPRSVGACSTIAAGRLATADGSTLATHSNDGGGATDGRLVRVPARDHPAGSVRPIYYATENYPRYVGPSLGPMYMSTWAGGAAGFNDSVPIGTIPEVAHTYAYFTATYGLMNEHQVGFGESTCACLFGAKPVNKGGHALLSIDTLTQIALERAKTAREAIATMGELAVKHGFYGEGFEGSGESLMVIDPKEAWVFHVSPDGRTDPGSGQPIGGDSAIWVAQKVPDDSVAVVDDMYVIREVNLSDTENFMGSASVHAVAKEQGLWNHSAGLLDFAGVYSHGEYGHKYYSGRRMWGSFRRLVPEVRLSPTYGNLKTDQPHPYPFALAPARKLNVSDVMATMRDHYEGTPFSSAVGLAAGAFGNPNRYGGGVWPNGSAVAGNWERTISIHRSTYTTVAQARAWLPDAVGGTLWFGPHAAHATCYVPLPAGMPTLPHRYTVGAQQRKDSSALWAFRYTENLAQMRYGPMMADIAAAQRKLERQGLAVQQMWGAGGRGPESAAESVVDGDREPRERESVLRRAFNLSMAHADAGIQPPWFVGGCLARSSWAGDVHSASLTHARYRPPPPPTAAVSAGQLVGAERDADGEARPAGGTWGRRWRGVPWVVAGCCGECAPAPRVGPHAAQRLFYR
eukprot:COSAG01_NODE_10404_length_2175_cov_2.057322_1_plen_644_part_00